MDVEQVMDEDSGGLELTEENVDMVWPPCRALRGMMLQVYQRNAMQLPFLMLVPFAQVLGEIRPYLVGTGGGELSCKGLDGPIVKVAITGPASKVMTVRVAVTQKLREKIPSIAAVQLM
jgi:Fe-S cluster biogenesis protein NfuA